LIRWFSAGFRRLKAFAMARKAQEKSIPARVVLTDDEEEQEVRRDELEVNGVAYRIPSDVPLVNIQLSENISETELLSFLESVTDKENKIKENDPSDQYINFTWDKQKRLFNKNTPYPDGWRKAIYPAGKSSTTDNIEGGKPNIQMIRQWVEDVKLAGKSQRELEQEYNVMYEQDSMNGWNKKKMDNLINSIAFAVARKIWYVGRKPSDMSDIAWDEETQHMRPSDGSYNKGQKGRKYGETGSFKDVPENWGERGNPYVQDKYSYTSGDPDERGREE
jgi:hypothetical protein|tara:strand:- start:438 stop:1268 length:831 start_codon:yes stop_codon:yes gene_type:complete